MSYVPLHHKYRPQTFGQLVGQEAIATTLTNAIVNRKIAPAYLFTGPRGTGKTSSARILAKSLNCLKSDVPTPDPCGECEVCRMIALGSALDVIEIDAASNTGVDNIRELIEKSQFAPVQCRYKVYVIDECHMLSQAAFNALLKTLEEPPERVVFVLATTDPQRVLSTIISRCQRFDYRRIPLESMVNHLIKIAQNETIEIEKDAITLVAQIANGGLRDAQSLLDQLSLLSGTITVDKVWDLVGAVPEKDLLQLIKEIRNNNSEGVINQCRHLMNRGREPIIVLQNLANFYLSLLIAKTAPQRSDLVAVTAPTWEQLCQEGKEWEIFNILQGQKLLKDSEFQLKNTTQPRLWLEVTLLSLLPSAQVKTVVVETNNQNVKNNPSTVVQKPQNINTNVNPNINTTIQEKQPINNSNIQEKPPIQKQVEPVNSVSQPQANNKGENNQNSDNLSNQQIWQKFLEIVHPPTTKALFQQQCYLISISGNVIYIGVKNEPLLKLAQGKIPNAEVAFQQILNQKVQVKIQVENAQTQKKNINNKVDRLAQTNHNIIQNNILRSSFSKPKKIDNQPHNQPPEIKEKPQEKPPINPPPLPDNVIKFEPKNKVDQTEISETEFDHISSQLAEVFKGEVIEISDYFNIDYDQDLESVEGEKNHDHEVNKITPSEKRISSEKNPPNIIIINRPSINFDDEDEIPF